MTVIRLAVLGDPIDHSRSPDLHRAALAALGLEGDSRAIRTPAGTLRERLTALAAEGVHGVNLTHPLKEEALDCLARVSDTARRARSVNTVGLDPAGWWGDTTDGLGCVDFIHDTRRDPAHQKVVILGAGGAARSLAVALIDRGCDDITVSSRRFDAAAWWEIPGVHDVPWRSPAETEALGRASVVVNATPIRDQLPAPLSVIRADALLVDLVYDRELTPWIEAWNEVGGMGYDGLGVLVQQAKHGLSRLLGRDVPYAPLARAVGWMP